MKLLTSNSQKTLDLIHHHPTTHNLEWRDIRKLIQEIGEAEQEHNGNLKLTVSGHTLIIQGEMETKIATENEIHELRRLLQGAEVHDVTPVHSLLVIDHESAKLYRTEFRGSVPETITPYDPDGSKSHVHIKHSYNGHEAQSNHHEYFEDIVKLLHGDEPLLIFGSGHGNSSTMNMFATWLNERYPKIAGRIVRLVDLDQSHLTEFEMLAKARSIFAL